MNKRKIMTEIKFTKEQLEKRRDEVRKQLGEVNEDERIELDNDMEDQAIQMEQHEVSVTMEENLRKELIQIEDKLLEMDEREA
jgi:RNA polymerase-binding transcription factor DksA